MTPVERFDAKVTPEPNTGCWLWTASVSKAGYGLLNVDGKTTYAHRMAFERAGGVLIPGLELDHLCRNRSCCNPTHLRQVTRRENIMARGSLSPGKAHAAKTHCPQGHEYTPENTHMERLGNRFGRRCKACSNRRRSERKRRARMAARMAARP